MANTLELFVNTIRNYYQQQVSTQLHKDIYTALRNNSELLVKNLTNLDNLLPIFQLPEFTLPHMAILNVLAHHATSTSTISLDKLLNDIESCIQLADDKQVQIGTELFTELCHFYTNKLCDQQISQTRSLKKGIRLLVDAIKKVQTSENQLTSVHSDLLQLCLAAKYFEPGLKFINKDILDINKENETYDSKYYLSYFYYAGCIFAALKEFDQALFHFEQAITIPCNAISQIMIESYKKFLLISLILNGKLNLLPKYTSRIVVNQIKPLCNAYHELATAFTNYDLDKLNVACTKYNDLFQQDRNAGLVKQVQQSFYKKNIQKLTKSYITLSLADMATKVKLQSAKEAEQYVFNMIADGEIYATINQKDGMVSFHDNPEKYNSTKMASYLTDQMFNCIDIDKKIKDMDKEITVHPHYIQKCMNNAATGGSGNGTGGQLDDSDQSFYPKENMM